ncbi:MAG TPA: sigma-70 family RNA polymerase sigma factor, partial [Solirubrobacter sp.]|nr:sigma-70 family RNA polymerase sigma factor [Solirubrobacter sp.]
MAAIAFRFTRDAGLRSRAARGDAAAFAAIYERHQRSLYGYCRSILRHEQDAQDALQSTMTRAFAALQDERREIDLRPWLFRIAHNEAVSILRRRRASAELPDVPSPVELEDRVADREEVRILRLDLADLPDRQRAALVLRELNGLSHAEIASVLGVTPAAVKQAIFEGRSALTDCRSGRAIACAEVQRMLSDGDGRVLRGRSVRAHLRACDGCRGFRRALDARPRALRALLPPLPVGGVAALLGELLVGGGTAAKLATCVALVGGGGAATLAVELRGTRDGASSAAGSSSHAHAAEAASSKPPRGQRAVTPPVAMTTQRTATPPVATTVTVAARTGVPPASYGVAAVDVGPRPWPHGSPSHGPASPPGASRHGAAPSRGHGAPPGARDAARPPGASRHGGAGRRDHGAPPWAGHGPASSPGASRHRAARSRDHGAPPGARDAARPPGASRHGGARWGERGAPPRATRDAARSPGASRPGGA